MWDLAEDLCHPLLQLPFLAACSVELLAGLGRLRNRNKGARREKKGTEGSRKELQNLTHHSSSLHIQLSPLVLLQGTDTAMDPLSELQDDLTLDDTSPALNQLKLASIDEKNWPSDEMPDFPKSGEWHNVSGNCRYPGEEAPSCWRGLQGVRLGQGDQP